MTDEGNMDYEDIIREISPKLRWVVRKVYRCNPSFDTDDLYQEAMLYLWLDFNNGKLQNKTVSYILQGCYFHLKNYIRKNHTKKHSINIEQISKENEKIVFNNLLRDKNSEYLFEEVDCRIFIDWIKNKLLTKREAEVFCLSMEGLTTREIGKTLGISHVSVIKIKRKVRDKCESYL